VVVLIKHKPHTPSSPGKENDMKPTDQNGNKLFRDIRKEGDKWGVNVWAGTWPTMTTVSRYYYATRAEARNADISDLGKNATKGE
jgi:hypothetical protein